MKDMVEIAVCAVGALSFGLWQGDFFAGMFMYVMLMVMAGVFEKD